MDRLQEIKNEANLITGISFESALYLIQTVEQYQRQETILLGRLKKAEAKMFDCERKTKWQVYEENLKLAQENALLKGEMSG